MNEFFTAHRTLVVSSLYFVFAALFCGYATLYVDRAASIIDARNIDDYLRREAKNLSVTLATIAEHAKQTGAPVNSVEKFLRNFNEIAKNENVIIRRLTPDQQDSTKFTIDILVDYYTFLRFSAGLESRDITITDLQVHPYSMGELDKDNKPKSLPQHVISFTISPRNNAEPLSNDRLRALKDQVAQQNKRNPFQRFAFDSKLKSVSQSIDLTWIFTMTGMGKDPNGTYATIDHRDYYENGTFDKTKHIDSIAGDRVNMSEDTPNGKQTYVLKYRPAATAK